MIIKNKKTRFIIKLVLLLISTLVLIFKLQSDIPAGYSEVPNYNNPKDKSVMTCMAMTPECGVCEEAYGGYKLINGKCYGREN